jgi:hypothetical protein
LIELVVTADDFGADLAVNEAVETAYREGVLTAASLMGLRFALSPRARSQLSGEIEAHYAANGLPPTRAGLSPPGTIFGLANSGQMDTVRTARALAGLSHGFNEPRLSPPGLARRAGGARRARGVLGGGRAARLFRGFCRSAHVTPVKKAVA